MGKQQTGPILRYEGIIAKACSDPYIYAVHPNGEEPVC